MSQFRLKPFLRYINTPLISEYLQTHNIDLEISKDVDDKERVDKILQTIENEDETVQNKIEAELAEVKELSNESGTVIMTQLMQERDSGSLEGLSEAGNDRERALWLFMNNKKVFDDSRILHYIEDLSSKHIRKVRFKRDIPSLRVHLDKLSLGVSEYFKAKEGRGKNCKSDFFEYSDRAVFIVYPEGHIATVQHYKKGNLSRLTAKPAFQIVFIYYPEEEVIEVSAKGGKKKIDELANIFNREVLEDSEKLRNNYDIFDLNQILNSGFDIPVDPEDQIEDLYLKQLRFTNKINKRVKIILEIYDANGLEDMLKEIAYRRVDLKYFNITQATFKFKFKGAGNRGSVTMQLTYPDRTSLTDKPLHQKAKKYISKWGLIHENPIK